MSEENRKTVLITLPTDLSVVRIDFPRGKITRREWRYLMDRLQDYVPYLDAQHEGCERCGKFMTTERAESGATMCRDCEG